MLPSGGGAGAGSEAGRGPERAAPHRCEGAACGAERSEEEGAPFGAADQGCADARFRLGLCCEFGQGVTQDLDRAAELLRAAAEQDVAGAREALDRVEKKRRSSSGSAGGGAGERRRGGFLRGLLGGRRGQ